MRAMVSLLFLLIGAIEPSLAQQMIKCVDETGTTIFSKSACGENAEKIDVPAVNSVPDFGSQVQPAYLKASNTGFSDFFGFSVAVSGNTVVVGAYLEDSSTTGVDSKPNELAKNSGAAYVFHRTANTWTQQAYIKASNTGASDFFGYSVAISGDTVVVGARAEASSTTGVDSIPNDSAIQAGAAYVFHRVGTAWTQQAYLKASNTDANDIFGESVAISGDTILVGAFQESSSTTGVNSTPNNSLFGAGAAYVFSRSKNTWTQQAYLKSSNTGEDEQFAESVAISGYTLVAGAWREDSSSIGVNGSQSDNLAENAGAAYAYFYDLIFKDGFEK